jgi:hypothetical protein
MVPRIGAKAKTHPHAGRPALLSSEQPNHKVDPFLCKIGTRTVSDAQGGFFIVQKAVEIKEDGKKVLKKFWVQVLTK